MTPEAPGNLVVLDLRFKGEALAGSVERVSPPQDEPTQGSLRVRFDARTKEKGFYPVGDGVAWVSQPAGYVHTDPEPVGKVHSPDGLQFYYNHVAYGEGFMLIVVLPRDYTLAESSPPPRGAKEFRGRIAAYFKPAGSFGADTRVCWTLKKVGGNLKADVRSLHKYILTGGKAPSHSGVVVDDEDPTNLRGGTTAPSAWDFWWISLIAALVGIGLLVVDIYKGSALPATVQNLIYYVVLLITALSCSIALFGILHTKAHITYKHLGTVVELSGASALFILIVYVGLGAKGSNTFDLTVRAYGDQTAITSGKIAIDLGTDRREEAIGPKGEANFKRIPPEFAGRKLKVFPHVEGYEEAPQELPIVDDVIEITLGKAHPETVLRGTIQPMVTGKGFVVRVEGQDGETTVDKYGEFKLPVKGKEGDLVRVRVFSDQRLVYDDYQVLPGPVILSLRESP
jgi:hypothetical protein